MIRALTEIERQDLMANRDALKTSGESVIDLEKFEPLVEMDERGVPWLIYRKREKALKK